MMFFQRRSDRAVLCAVDLLVCVSVAAEKYNFHADSAKNNLKQDSIIA